MSARYQNDIPELDVLDNSRYENLFRVYNVEDSPKNFYYYNITKGVKIDPDNIDPAYIYNITIDRDVPWTTLSYKLYNTIYLWWIIKIINPDTDLFIVKSGTELKLIRPEFIDQVLELIQSQIKT